MQVRALCALLSGLMLVTPILAYSDDSTSITNRQYSNLYTSSYYTPPECPSPAEYDFRTRQCEAPAGCSTNSQLVGENSSAACFSNRSTPANISYYCNDGTILNPDALTCTGVPTRPICSNGTLWTGSACPITKTAIESTSYHAIPCARNEVLIPASCAGAQSSYCPSAELIPAMCLAWSPMIYAAGIPSCFAPSILTPGVGCVPTTQAIREVSCTNQNAEIIPGTFPELCGLRKELQCDADGTITPGSTVCTYAVVAE